MAEKKEGGIEITLFGGDDNKSILEKIMKSKAKLRFKNFRLFAEEAEIIFPALKAKKSLIENADIKDKSIIKRLMEGGEITIENFETTGDEVEITIPSFVQQIITAGFGTVSVSEGQAQSAVAAKQIEKLLEFKFDVSRISEKSKMEISEVTLGATRTEGGSRDSVVKIGGETTMPFYFFEGMPKNKSVVSNDIFDMPSPLPKVVKDRFKTDNKTPDEIMADPGEWAKFRVEKCNAKVITLHLVSTDPNVKDASVQDAMKTISHVLQSVKVPIVVGGSGNPQKDPLIFKEAAEMFAGERLLFSTISGDMEYENVVKACIKYGHNIGTLVSMNPDDMRRLNTNMLKAGLPRNQLAMDPFTAGIGYGIEYSISSMERCRLAGLNGEEALAVPIISATSNVWAAREAWKKDDKWGPREVRGPLYEAGTGLIALLCGANIFYSLDVLAIEILNRIIDSLYELKGEKDKKDKYISWITS